MRNIGMQRSSLTSGLTFVKRPQSETQTGRSGVCYDNAKLLHQQKAEAADVASSGVG